MEGETTISNYGVGISFSACVATLTPSTCVSTGLIVNTHNWKLEFLCRRKFPLGVWTRLLITAPVVLPVKGVLLQTSRNSFTFCVVLTNPPVKDVMQI